MIDRLKLVPLLLLILGTTHMAAAQRSRDPRLSLDDKRTIVQLAMELKLKSEGPLKFSQNSVFRSGEMSAALLPKIPGFPFRLMTRAAIERRTKTREGFRFLDVTFSPKGEAVEFDLHIIERRGGLPMYSHVHQYIFRKSGKTWQGQVMWVIC